MSTKVLLASGPGAFGSSIAGVLGRGYDVIPWEPGEPVPESMVAVDAHVVDAAVKARALWELDNALPPDVPIVTCCHSASATELSRGLTDPARVVGFALLPPVEARTIVECSAGYHTSQNAASVAGTLFAACGLEAVWVADSAGLVTPRVIACLANEAAFTVMERTASPEDVDRAMELGTGYPRGPLTWAELVGLEHIVAILDGLAREHGEDRYRACPLLRRLAAGGAGVGTGSGGAPDAGSGGGEAARGPSGAGVGEVWSRASSAPGEPDSRSQGTDA